MRSLNYYLLVLFLLAPTFSFSQSKFCLNWFKTTKINYSDENCISKCIHHEKDISESICGFDCSKFCKSQKCKIEPYWNEKIKNGRPENWDYSSEKTIEWSINEKEQIEELLGRMPKDLNKLPLKGIYRVKKSVDIVNPASTSYDGKIIVLYNNTFEHPSWRAQEVLLHEIGHSIYSGYSTEDKQKYEKNLDGKKTIKAFILSRARLLAQEQAIIQLKTLLKILNT